MHILIIYKQYEIMKTALPIAYIQFLNQLKKSRTCANNVGKVGQCRTCSKNVGKVGHVGQLGALHILCSSYLVYTVVDCLCNNVCGIVR